MVAPPYSDPGSLSPGSKCRCVLEPLLLLSESSPSLVASLIHLAFLERNRNSPSEGLISVLSKATRQQRNSMIDGGKGAEVALDLFMALRCVVQIALWRRDVVDVRKASSSVLCGGGDSEKKGSDGWGGVNGGYCSSGA